MWAAHWHHLANMTEPSMCGGDAALCQITLTTCLVWLLLSRQPAWRSFVTNELPLTCHYSVKFLLLWNLWPHNWVKVKFSVTCSYLFWISARCVSGIRVIGATYTERQKQMPVGHRYGLQWRLVAWRVQRIQFQDITQKNAMPSSAYSWPFSRWTWLGHFYHTQWTVEGSVFRAISLWFFVCIWNISGTTEKICTTFARKTCLVPHSDEFEGQGQRSRSQRTKRLKAAFFGPFGGLRVVYVW